jgi:hypothetical protein
MIRFQDPRVAALAGKQRRPGCNLIEQTINDARDPDRIRFVTKQAIEEAVSFPLETHRNQAGVARY